MTSKTIHNVRDGRSSEIGSFEIEPLTYADLKPEDVGRTVIYQDHGRAEAGTLTSWRAGLVFARYTRGDTAAGAHPNDLSFGVRCRGSDAEAGGDAADQIVE